MLIGWLVACSGRWRYRWWLVLQTEECAFGMTNPLESQHGFAEFDRVAAMHPFRANGAGQLCGNGNPAAAIRQ
jgi:hypothetical protein